jgi:hypothetical protein
MRDSLGKVSNLLLLAIAIVTTLMTVMPANFINQVWADDIEGTDGNDVLEGTEGDDNIES